MPSLVEKRRGNCISFEIRFMLDKKRQTLFLGKRSDAKVVFEMFSRLLEAKENNASVPPYINAWVENLDKPTYARLHSFGLVEVRPGTITIRELYQKWKNYPVERKENTLLNNRTAYLRVIDFFDPETKVEDITEEDALKFKNFLTKRKYAPATVTGVIKKLNGWFGLGIRLKLVKENPFKYVKCESQVNESRKVYVRPEWYPLLLAACPNQSWRTLISLCRIGGLRCDSETSILRWSDVDWKKDRITVRSPKTERYKGKEQRVIPLFPELKTELLRQKKVTGKAQFVLPDNFTRANTQNRLNTIIARAGIVPWTKPFQNMRASREVDLLQSFPAHVVAAWIGHSVAIETRHYVFLREEDYTKGAVFTK